jgi:hypothetical protein
MACDCSNVLLPFKFQNQQHRHYVYIQVVSCGQSTPTSHKIYPVLQRPISDTSATLQIAVVILCSIENNGEETAKCRPTYFILIMVTGTKLCQKYTEYGLILA